MSQQLDKRIIDKLKELMNEGVRDPKEMRRALERYARKELFAGEQLPLATSRRFFPLKRDISNHMYLVAMKLRFSKIDQENISLTLSDWKKENPTDHYFFRPYGITELKNIFTNLSNYIITKMAAEFQVRDIDHPNYSSPKYSSKFQ